MLHVDSVVVVDNILFSTKKFTVKCKKHTHTSGGGGGLVTMCNRNFVLTKSVLAVFYVLFDCDKIGFEVRQ
jgi:hypothetical protein